MRKLTCSTVPHNRQRYDTLGDYMETVRGEILFCVSDCGDWRMEAMLFMHELVEYLLARKDGIEIKTVDEWDLNHLTDDEPGALPDCPYRKAHETANAFEQMLASVLGVGWHEYEQRLDSITKKECPCWDWRDRVEHE
jgi:hypothetical protein